MFIERDYMLNKLLLHSFQLTQFSNEFKIYVTFQGKLCALKEKKSP